MVCSRKSCVWLRIERWIFPAKVHSPCCSSFGDILNAQLWAYVPSAQRRCGGVFRKTAQTLAFRSSFRFLTTSYGCFNATSTSYRRTRSLLAEEPLPINAKPSRLWNRDVRASYASTLLFFFARSPEVLCVARARADLAEIIASSQKKGAAS